MGLEKMWNMIIPNEAEIKCYNNYLFRGKISFDLEDRYSKERIVTLTDNRLSIDEIFNYINNMTEDEWAIIKSCNPCAPEADLEFIQVNYGDKSMISKYIKSKYKNQPDNIISFIIQMLLYGKYGHNTFKDNLAMSKILNFMNLIESFNIQLNRIDTESIEQIKGKLENLPEEKLLLQYKIHIESDCFDHSDDICQDQLNDDLENYILNCDVVTLKFLLQWYEVFADCFVIVPQTLDIFKKIGYFKDDYAENVYNKIKYKRGGIRNTRYLFDFDTIFSYDVLFSILREFTVLEDDNETQERDCDETISDVLKRMSHYNKNDILDILKNKEFLDSLSEKKVNKTFSYNSIKWKLFSSIFMIFDTVYEPLMPKEDFEFDGRIKEILQYFK